LNLTKRELKVVHGARTLKWNGCRNLTKRELKVSWQYQTGDPRSAWISRRENWKLPRFKQLSQQRLPNLTKRELKVRDYLECIRREVVSESHEERIERFTKSWRVGLLPQQESHEERIESSLSTSSTLKHMKFWISRRENWKKYTLFKRIILLSIESHEERIERGSLHLPAALRGVDEESHEERIERSCYVVL